MSLENEFNSKSVILVGNSSSVLKQSKGDFIDSHDCVVRFNLAAEQLHHYDQKHVGRKFDVWVYAMKNYPRCSRTINNMVIKPRVFIRYGELNGFPNGELKTKSLVLPTHLKNEVKSTLGINKHPSTGIVFLHYVLHYTTPKQVNLIGFDSFSKGNFYDTKRRVKGEKWHDIDAEKRYINNLVTNNSIQLI